MTVVTFKTKTEVFEFLNALNQAGIRGKIAPTPKEIKIGCGLSVEVPPNSYYQAYLTVKNGYYPTFKGVYSLTKRQNVKILKRLI